MLSKQECYKILLDMRADGVNVNKPISQLASAPTRSTRGNKIHKRE